MTDPITKSSGNIFKDLGFPDYEAENLFIRSRLMFELGEFIKKEKLTQAGAAKLMGVKQPRISDLVRGKIDRFTIDMLVNMLAKIGLKIEVSLKKAA